MIRPVHQIADVMEISGDLHQFHGPLGISQRLKDIAGRLRHKRHMREPVLGISQRIQRLIRLLDISFDHFIILDLFVGHLTSPTSFFSSFSWFTISFNLFQTSC